MPKMTSEEFLLDEILGLCAGTNSLHSQDCKGAARGRECLKKPSAH